MTDPSDTGSFTYRRVHRAPPDLLFDCMTQPEHLTCFWGPAGTSAPADRITVAASNRMLHWDDVENRLG